jgi:SAM-dependent methyltransferase
MQLDQVVPWGRTLAEYRLMFDLSEADLNQRILGCGDGPASFNAEMAQQGHQVVSIDPLYAFTAAQIQQRVEATYEPIVTQVRQNPDRYCWDLFRDPEALGQARLAAMQTFLQDYETGKAAGRYLTQALPRLDFADSKFDLCLCSHLLFLYSEQLSLEFHLTSIRELLRVASEVRIFPLLQLGCQPSPYIEPVLQALADQFMVEIQPVAYEFQKGGNQMMRLSRLLDTPYA